MRAEFLFSVDVATDELVKINPATGNVSVIGPLGFNAQDVDLTNVNGRLFALNAELDVRVDLYELNPATASVISSVQVFTDSNFEIQLAEALSHVSGQLKIGFRDSAAPFPARSNAFGDLGFDGVVSNIQSNVTTYVDFDGLGVDLSTGILYSPDGNPAFINFRPGDTDFFSVQESPLALNFITTDSTNFSANDVAVLSNQLYAMGQPSNLLAALDLNTNGFSTITLSRSGNYFGLATAIPEPSPIACLSLLLATFVGWRLKRKMVGGFLNPSSSSPATEPN